MSIFNNLRDLTSDFQNFAYICKFDPDSRRFGKEFLYLSNSEPIEIFDAQENPSSSYLTDVIEKNRNRIKNDLREFGIPLYVSYDYVKTIYPDIDLKMSKWPLISALIPDKVEYNVVKRENDSFSLRRGGNFADERTEKKIGELIKRVYEGELLQIVLSRKFELGPIDPFEIIEYFIERDRSLYVYYYKFGDFEIVGSSPENLVSLENNVLTINPIAGTRKRGDNDTEELILQQELLKDQKELKEHRMLVDLARNDLAKLSVPGTVKVTRSMEVQKFASVQHLVSSVSSRMFNGTSLDDVLKAVFPAGTVSGAPKKRAIRLINEYEEYPRGAYAGAIGIAKDNYLDLALLIRSIFSHLEERYLQAGAGIVKDSVPATEVQEIYSKAMTVIGGLKNESPSYR